MDVDKLVIEPQTRNGIFTPGSSPGGIKRLKKSRLARPLLENWMRISQSRIRGNALFLYSLPAQPRGNAFVQSGRRVMECNPSTE